MNQFKTFGHPAHIRIARIFLGKILINFLQNINISHLIKECAVLIFLIKSSNGSDGVGMFGNKRFQIITMMLFHKHIGIFNDGMCSVIVAIYEP